ncbi:hypothetical protein BGZ50_006907 [Haplosporangium sp. Z 11]|nr:hypothetical protein BGZ50_006907 [Haplosporangium sp. Z 11]
MHQREKRPRPIYWILSDSGEDSDDQDVISKDARSKDAIDLDSKEGDANESIILIASDDEDMDMEVPEENKDMKDTIIHDVQASPGSASVLHRQHHHQQYHQHHRDSPPEDSFDEDDDDDTDRFYGGDRVEIPRGQQHKPPVDVDYVELMNRSYRISQSQYLAYQREILQQREKSKLLPSAHKGPQVEMPENITKEEMEVVFAAVGRCTQELRPVDWDDIANGSVVDMALKESTMKLAVANVATQDIYNRPGNLLLCDLNKGETWQLQGHEEQNEATASQRTKTVNDIKLSYSQNFFISASDDHKTMIWDAETGELVNTLGNEIVCGTSGRTVLGEDENGDGYLRVLDVKYAKEVQSAYSGHEDVNLVDFSPCEQYIISCSNNNEVAVFDRRFLREPALHRFHHASKEDDDANAGITSALWWPSCMGSNRPMLVSGGGDGTVKLWDIQRATEDAEIWSLEVNLGPVARVTASASFEHLIVGGDTGAVSLFSFDHGIVSRYHEQPMILHPDSN